MEKLIVKLQKGGDTIGFSFCMDSNYNISNDVSFCKNKNTNYKF